MLYFKEHKFAYLHINKTAGSSTKEFLIRVVPEAPIDIGLRSRPRDSKPMVHEPLASKVVVFDSMGVEFRGLKILTTIRNPYERWVSLYTAAIRNYKEKNPITLYERAYAAASMPFDKWLEDYVFGIASYRDPQHGPQSRYLFVDYPLYPNLRIPDNVTLIKSEDVDIEVPKFIEKELGIKTDLQLPRRNVSNYMRDKDTMDYYPDHLRKLVYQKEKYIIDRYYPEFK